MIDHKYDYRPNWMTQSPINRIYNKIRERNKIKPFHEKNSKEKSATALFPRVRERVLSNYTVLFGRKS